MKFDSSRHGIHSSKGRMPKYLSLLPRGRGTKWATFRSQFFLEQAEHNRYYFSISSAIIIKTLLFDVCITNETRWPLSLTCLSVWKLRVIKIVIKTSSKNSKKNVAPIQSDSCLVKTNFSNRVKWQSIIVFSFPQASVGYVILLQL